MYLHHAVRIVVVDDGLSRTCLAEPNLLARTSPLDSSRTSRDSSILSFSRLFIRSCATRHFVRYFHLETLTHFRFISFLFRFAGPDLRLAVFIVTLCTVVRCGLLRLTVDVATRRVTNWPAFQNSAFVGRASAAILLCPCASLVRFQCRTDVLFTFTLLFPRSSTHFTFSSLTVTASCFLALRLLCAYSWILLFASTFRGLHDLRF